MTEHPLVSASESENCWIHGRAWLTLRSKSQMPGKRCTALRKHGRGGTGHGGTSQQLSGEWDGELRWLTDYFKYIET